MPVTTFPDARQAQIIRANQRDLYHVASFREQTDTVLRSWLGSRWLTRWEREVELAVQLVYYGLSTLRGIQTLGEEYTDIWQLSNRGSRLLAPSRAALITLSTLPHYILARWGSRMSDMHQHVRTAITYLPAILDAVTAINLALFYIRGHYYDFVKRILGIKHVSSTIEDPRSRPPSYALLGFLLSIRLLHQLHSQILPQILPGFAQSPNAKKAHDQASDLEVYVDDRPVSSLTQSDDPEGEPAKPAEEDRLTMLDITSLTPAQRATRTCTLCLEERTETTSTECGHLFCWTCIVGWGREKAECPLCRQALSLKKLLPVYSL